MQISNDIFRTPFGILVHRSQIHFCFVLFSKHYPKIQIILEQNLLLLLLI